MSGPSGGTRRRPEAAGHGGLPLLGPAFIAFHCVCNCRTPVLIIATAYEEPTTGFIKSSVSFKAALQDWMLIAETAPATAVTFAQPCENLMPPHRASTSKTCPMATRQRSGLADNQRSPALPLPIAKLACSVAFEAILQH